MFIYYSVIPLGEQSFCLVTIFRSQAPVSPPMAQPLCLDSQNITKSARNGDARLADSGSPKGMTCGCHRKGLKYMK